MFLCLQPIVRNNFPVRTANSIFILLFFFLFWYIFLLFTDKIRLCVFSCHSCWSFCEGTMQNEFSKIFSYVYPLNGRLFNLRLSFFGSYDTNDALCICSPRVCKCNARYAGPRMVRKQYKLDETKKNEQLSISEVVSLLTKQIREASRPFCKFGTVCYRLYENYPNITQLYTSVCSNLSIWR